MATALTCHYRLKPVAISAVEDDYGLDREISWQPVSAEPLYPAIESARPRSRGGHKIRVISAQIEFLGGTGANVTRLYPRETPG